MNGLWETREEPCSPTDPEVDSGIDSDLPDRSGLLRTGIVSLLLHAGLVFLLSLSLDPAITKGGSSVYQVWVRPISPPEREMPETQPAPDLRRRLPVPSNPPLKSQIQKVDNKSKPEINRREPVISKNQDLETLASTPSVKTENWVEEPKQPLSHREEEEPVKEPIPFPMAAGPPSSAELEKPPEITIQDAGRIEIAGRGGSGWGGFDHGSGSGQGGSGLDGSVEGTGIGQERSGRGGSGEGAGKGGPGGGGFGEEVGTGPGGSGKGAGSGQGTSGWGSGDGSGPGRGIPGWGSSGKGGTGVARPGYVENPKPTYPQEARERGCQGEVLLRVEVLPNGRVGQIEVKKSSGHEVLDQSALATVKKWKFIPARKGEVVIPFWVNIPIKFQLL